MLVSWFEVATPRIDVSGCGEKAETILHCDLLRVGDFSIRSAGNNLPEVSVGTNRRGRHVTNFFAGHETLVNNVVISVDLDVKVLDLHLVSGVNVGHMSLLFLRLMVSRYQDTESLTRQDIAVSWWQ
jgi:hypothetical protein